MAARLIWSTEALDDLNAIAEYIHRDSPYHAQRVVDAALALIHGRRSLESLE